MKRIKNLFTIALTLIASTQLYAQTIENRVERVIDSILKPYNDTVPGAVMQVVYKGKPLYHKAYGLADLELGVRLNTESVFEAASVSKQFTATCILLLADEGKLNLDDDVRKYVPKLPDYGKTITIKNLLTHTSGLRDWRNVGYITEIINNRWVYNDGDALNIIYRQQALNFPPNTKYSYSNSNYDLLAFIVSKVSGKSFVEYSTEKLLKPIGMHNSTWRNDYRSIIKNRAKSYLNVNGKFVTQNPLDNTNGAAGLITNTNDLQKWIAYWRDGKFGERIAKLRVQKVTLDDKSVPTYVLGGVNYIEKGNETLITHGGLLAGYRALASYYPDLDLAITFLSNTRESIVPRVVENILPLFSDNVKDKNKPKYQKMEPAVLKSRAGKYKSSLGYRVVDLEIKNDSLFVKNGQALKALSKDTMTNETEKFVFKKDGLYLIEEEAYVKYNRVNDYSPSKEELNSFVNSSYYSKDAEQKITFDVGRGSLRYTRNGYTYVYLKPAYRTEKVVAFSGFDNGLSVTMEFSLDKRIISVNMPRALHIEFLKISD